jgi:hypothetical protein
VQKRGRRASRNWGIDKEGGGECTSRELGREERVSQVEEATLYTVQSKP